MDRIDKLKKYLEQTPQDSFLKHALALEYVKLNDDKPARTLFEEILNHDPAYIGSYYHLAKLLERGGEYEQAKEWYEKGMIQAKQAGDNHALNELRMAYDDIDD